VNLPIEGPLADQIDDILAQLREVCPTSPIRKKIDFVKHTALTAIADRTTLRAMNQSLVEKTTTWRKKNTAKHFGEARVLVVEDLLNKAQEREVKDAEEAQAKTRRAALRGKVGFAKLVWKEFSMSSDLFE
jgi:exoribonuclease II